MKAPPPKGAYACNWKRRAGLQKKLTKFMVNYSDFPASEARKAVRDMREWDVWCDREGEIIAAARVAQSDWYLCTLKNAAVRPDQRGKRLGSKLYRGITDRALRSPNCLVLAADVTSTNLPSIKALERVGFKTVNKFCWSKNDPPGDILHYVKMPPKGRHKC